MPRDSPSPRRENGSKYRRDSRERRRAYDEPEDSRRRYRNSEDDYKYAKCRDEDTSRRRRNDYERDNVDVDRRSRDRDRHRDRDGDRDKDREARRDNRGGPSSSRRSASPSRRARSASHRSRSKSKSAELEDKAKPNFKPSGLLAAATKTVKHSDGTGTVLKYHEPPEARKPSAGWRLYVFKGKEQVDLLHLHRQSAYLVGRDRLVVDINVDHPSCSKQHAVIQYRQVHEKNEFGDSKAAVKPFIIDLESTNGTMVNDETIPTSRYFELKLGDVIKFGESAREYVLLSEDAA